MNLVVQPSCVSEISGLAEVLQQANAHKQAHGDDIWGKYPFTHDEVAGLIDEGGMLTALVDKEVAGCVKITTEDQRIWEETGLDGKAFYIHRLATADRFRGQGLGRQIIDLVGLRAIEEDREFLRLDCPSDNELLCGYYMREGFSFVRSIEVAGRTGGIYRPSLFQRNAQI